MKKLILILMLVVTSILGSDIPKEFPKNWIGITSNGFEVTADKLGKYEGIETIEGGKFWKFQKTFLNGAKNSHYVRINYKENYLISFSEF
ncbi:hypothetical protein [Sulfurimonas sp.]|uniref:hypothetical protein n=1 Tax=Sulfurimonas sp. TaxID=2022749 RepID=UPI0025CEC546|nr:hypothetical protein [Sulfurimonas sp.]